MVLRLPAHLSTHFALQESIRARKKKVRSHSYSQRLELALYSEKSLGVILPEKPRQVYSGWSSGDTIAFVTAMPVSQLWRMSRTQVPLG